MRCKGNLDKLSIALKSDAETSVNSLTSSRKAQILHKRDIKNP